MNHILSPYPNYQTTPEVSSQPIVRPIVNILYQYLSKKTKYYVNNLFQI